MAGADLEGATARQHGLSVDAGVCGGVRGDHPGVPRPSYAPPAMSDVDVAIEVVVAGANVVRRRFGTALDRIEKAAGDFATAADLEAETAMLGVLHRRRPGDAIHGEEHGRSGPLDSSRTWLIDPLCGTLNYAVRMHRRGRPGNPCDADPTRWKTTTLNVGAALPIGHPRWRLDRRRQRALLCRPVNRTTPVAASVGYPGSGRAQTTRPHKPLTVWPHRSSAPATN